MRLLRKKGLLLLFRFSESVLISTDIIKCCKRLAFISELALNNAQISLRKAESLCTPYEYRLIALQANLIRIDKRGIEFAFCCYQGSVYIFGRIGNSVTDILHAKRGRWYNYTSKMERDHTRLFYCNLLKRLRVSPIPSCVFCRKTYHRHQLSFLTLNENQKYTNQKQLLKGRHNPQISDNLEFYLNIDLYATSEIHFNFWENPVALDDKMVPEIMLLLCQNELSRKKSPLMASKSPELRLDGGDKAREEAPIMKLVDYLSMAPTGGKIQAFYEYSDALQSATFLLLVWYQKVTDKVHVRQPDFQQQTIRSIHVSRLMNHPEPQGMCRTQYYGVSFVRFLVADKLCYQAICKPILDGPNTRMESRKMQKRSPLINLIQEVYDADALPQTKTPKPLKKGKKQSAKKETVKVDE
ncbi:hypothetical protein CLF_102135, partial [Clonorchis sinensis]